MRVIHSINFLYKYLSLKLNLYCRFIQTLLENVCNFLLKNAIKYVIIQLLFYKIIIEMTKLGANTATDLKYKSFYGLV